MLFILAGLTGVLASLFIHWLTWTLRLKYPSLTVVAGALSALGLTGFFLLYLTSDIANLMITVLIILWVIMLALGFLQAASLRILWWQGVLAVFFEMALAFLTGAAVNLTLQKYIPWFDQHFPGVDVYAVINAFLWGLAIPLLILAVIRPLIRWNIFRAGSPKADR
jgi:hypothetical protein